MVDTYYMQNGEIHKLGYDEYLEPFTYSLVQYLDDLGSIKRCCFYKNGDKMMTHIKTPFEWEKIHIYPNNWTNKGYFFIIENNKLQIAHGLHLNKDKWIVDEETSLLFVRIIKKLMKFGDFYKEEIEIIKKYCDSTMLVNENIITCEEMEELK